MVLQHSKQIVSEKKELWSFHLDRAVTIDCFLPTFVNVPEEINLLLINDGQDLEAMGFHQMIGRLSATPVICPVLAVGIHASADRKMEYGTAHCPDCKGRGARAGLYTQFIFQELIPFLESAYHISSFKEKVFAGFSLGALSALDIVWNHPDSFSKVGVFSGSLWWRKREMDEGYDEETDRIMHEQIKEGKYSPNLKFFFQTGTDDESEDRNNNGVIDSIDDTLSLIDDLRHKGYEINKDIVYLEMEGGRHEVETWGRAMPFFLRWAFPV